MSKQLRKFLTQVLVRPTLYVPAVSGVLSFWVGIRIAVLRYPGEFDWRYMTVSSLTSPARDPAGHLWASAGMLLCGLCGLWWATELVRYVNHKSMGSQPDGIAFLRAGLFFMGCAAVLPSWLLRIRKGHEILALLAFAGWCFGILRLTFHIVESGLRRRFVSANGRARLYAAAVVGAAVSPIFLAGIAQAYVRYSLPQLRWVSLTWRAQGLPAYLSFAFWEWITCAVLSAYMLGLSVAAQLETRFPKTIGGSASLEQ